MTEICYNDARTMQNQNEQQLIINPSSASPAAAGRELRRLVEVPEPDYLSLDEVLDATLPPAVSAEEATKQLLSNKLFGKKDAPEIDVIDLRTDGDPKIYFKPENKPDARFDLDPSEVDALFLDFHNSNEAPVPIGAYKQEAAYQDTGRSSRAMGRIRNFFRKEDVNTVVAPEKRRFAKKVAAVGVLAVAVVSGGVAALHSGNDSPAPETAAPTEEITHTVAVTSPEASSDTGAPAAAEVQQPAYDSNDTPWSVLAQAMPADQIAPTITQAMETAKANGHDVQKSGEGQNVYYSVDGDSSTAAIMAHISQ